MSREPPAPPRRDSGTGRHLERSGQVRTRRTSRLGLLRYCAAEGGKSFHRRSEQRWRRFGYELLSGLWLGGAVPVPMVMATAEALHYTWVLVTSQINDIQNFR